MFKAQLRAAKQKPVAIKLLLEKSVVAAFTVFGVANDGVGNMFEVAA
jgi:hypothetical protein